MMLPEGALAGRVAVITGGGTGMGKAMAERFVRLGARVVIASRNTENLEQVANEISEQTDGEVLPVGTDVRDPEQVNAMISHTKEAFGGVDILVNNAAGNFLAHAIDLSPKVLSGTWFCSQAAAREMISQGRGGAPGVAHSGAAKAGVLNL